MANRYLSAGTGIGRYPAAIEKAERDDINDAWTERVKERARKRQSAPGTRSLGPQFGKPSRFTASYARG